LKELPSKVEKYYRRQNELVDMFEAMEKVCPSVEPSRSLCVVRCACCAICTLRVFVYAVFVFCGFTVCCVSILLIFFFFFFFFGKVVRSALPRITKKKKRKKVQNRKNPGRLKSL
jgi:hypothetical protein